MRTKKRVGRGGKRGTTSGRGTKGQRSRAGHVIKPALRELVLRLPKRRGFRNKPKSDKPLVFNLSDLSVKLGLVAEKGKQSMVDATFLKKVNLLPTGYKGLVKLLGNGEINEAVTVNSKELKVSATAKTKIEKAGGKVE